MKNDVVYLLSITTGRDEDGFPIQQEQEFEVFARIESVKRSEYYNAAAIGVKAEAVVVINEDDYTECVSRIGKPSKVRIGDDDYKVVRSYHKRGGNDRELTLSEVEHE